MVNDMEYSSSPERGSFYRGVWKKQLDEGKTTEEIYKHMMSILDEYETQEKIIEKSSNLEYDLRSNEEVLNKARNSKIYSQNLYAALCNNDFYYADKSWNCSWRHAGGIIADMRQEGDYIDWYCSGIGSQDSNSGYVGEGFVTDEIRLDLLKMGWIVRPINEED